MADRRHLRLMPRTDPDLRGSAHCHIGGRVPHPRWRRSLVVWRTIRIDRSSASIHHPADVRVAFSALQFVCPAQRQRLHVVPLRRLALVVEGLLNVIVAPVPLGHALVLRESFSAARPVPGQTYGSCLPSWCWLGCSDPHPDLDGRPSGPLAEPVRRPLFVIGRITAALAFALCSASAGWAAEPVELYRSPGSHSLRPGASASVRVAWAPAGRAGRPGCWTGRDSTATYGSLHVHAGLHW